MPRNRPERSREDKSAELVEIARRLFREKGYEGTTMAGIAREAGIATNVVHYYFATKDELFVAALDSLQREDLERAKSSAASLEAALGEFVCSRLDQYGLIATLHERSHVSPVMAEFHERAHRRYEDALGRAIERFALPASERRLVVQALITAVESLVIHRASKRDAKRMMSFLAKRLIHEKGP